MNTPDTTNPMTPDALEAQHERDLAVLSRIEDREYRCFFCEMAELHERQRQEAGLT